MSLQLFEFPYAEREPRQACQPPPCPLGGGGLASKASFIYWNSLLTHQGIVIYKVFEGFRRNMHERSLKNLLSTQCVQSEIFVNLLNQFKNTKDETEQKSIFDEALCYLNNQEYTDFLKKSNNCRLLSPVQSRAIRKNCSKLFYYSQTRKFTSSKSGVHTMRVAFLTLTCPASVTPKQSLKAFEHFLDYLSRTANCNYVWKKEFGEKGGALHFHIMINNFIPYYIVAWKWKRLLLAEGVKWPQTESGEDTSSHYRIELPRNKKSTASYISKYMSKGQGLPIEYGYISGHSKILDSLKEISIIVDDLDNEELNKLASHSKVIHSEYVNLICTDLLHAQKLAPKIYDLFYSQYLRFSEIITLPQKFTYV
jgi:hypothetical protein